MNDLSSDLLLNIFSYLSVRDSLYVSATNRRFCYLVDNFHQYLCTPNLQVAAGLPLKSCRTKVTTAVVNETVIDLVKSATKKLQAPPNLALAFNTPVCHIYKQLPQLLPKDCVILGSISTQIQTSIESELNCKNRASVALANLSYGSTIRPFSVSINECRNISGMIQSILAGRSDYKLIIVYASQYKYVDVLIPELQFACPDAIIVGGLHVGGYVSLPIPENLLERCSTSSNTALISLIKSLGCDIDAIMASSSNAYTHKDLMEVVKNLIKSRKYYLQVMDGDDDNIYGVAVAGDNIPLRSVVSRGLESRIQIYNNPGLSSREQDTTPLSSTPYYIEACTTRSVLTDNNDEDDDEEDVSNLVDTSTFKSFYHQIQKVRNRETNTVHSIVDMWHTLGQPSFIGLRAPNQDGFDVVVPDDFILTRNNINNDAGQLTGTMFVADYPVNSNIPTLSTTTTTERQVQSPPTLLGYNVDFYNLTSQRCLVDVENCMKQLSEQTRDEDVLGALMFSCNGRGPFPNSFIGEDMADARRFAQYFPQVPLVGFYANGEIGPAARAGQQSAFQQGRASLQGFTVVFALFIVPKTKVKPSVYFDDSDQAVAEYIKKRFLVG